MTSAIRLSTLTWGRPGGPRVLLVHGVGANAASWWRVGSGVAELGAQATAVDLRGHGRSPASTSYAFGDHAADLALLGEGWDVVVGHSLGGPIVATRSIADRRFAERLVLLDPVFEVPDRDFDQVVADQIAEVDPVPDAGVLAAANPRWHPEDARFKVAAARATSGFVVERCLRDNAPWSHLGLLSSIDVPVRVLGADPELGAMFSPHHAVTTGVAYSAVAGAGHGIHRERPDAVVAAVRDVLAR